MKNNKDNKNSINQNQKSFFFDDFVETIQINKKLNKSKIYEDRLYALFSFFFSLVLIFSISIFSISIQESNFQGYKKVNYNYPLLRRDVLDRNGELLARNIDSYHAVVKSDLIKNKDNFILKIKLNFPEISTKKLKKKIRKQKKVLFKKKNDRRRKE